MTSRAPHRESGAHAIEPERRPAAVGAPLPLAESVRSQPELVASAPDASSGPPFWRRAARVALGSALIIVGVLELFLPGPGIVFVGAGLALLAPDVPFVRRALVALYRRWPRVRRMIPRRFRRTRHRDTDS